MIRFKICCISSIEEAALAIYSGASALGLVSSMPSGPGVISEETIAEIAAEIPPGVSTFLLTSLQDPEEIVAQHKRCLTSTIQLVDKIPVGGHADIRAQLPGVKLVQVIHVRDEEAIEEAIEVAPVVDAILLDSGNPKAKLKTLGGTGKKHNWAISRQIVEKVEVPVYLAGGINANNAVAAVKEVQPFGLDICSGVRLKDRLDRNLLMRFANLVRKF